MQIAHDKVDDKPKGYAFMYVAHAKPAWPSFSQLSYLSVFEHEASKTRALAKEFVIEGTAALCITWAQNQRVMCLPWLTTACPFLASAERTLILRECMGRNEYLRSRGLPEEKKSRKPAAADKSEAGQDAAAPVSWPSAPAGDAASGEKAHLPAVLKRMEEKKRKQGAAAGAAPPAKKQREREKDLSQVCRAFQQGKCSRGQNCKFAHTDKVQGGNGGDKKPKNEEGKDMKKKRNNMSQKKRKQMYLERTGQLESQ